MTFDIFLIMMYYENNHKECTRDKPVDYTATYRQARC